MYPIKMILFIKNKYSFQHNNIVKEVGVREKKRNEVRIYNRTQKQEKKNY
jgi:hypothetical protein